MVTAMEHNTQAETLFNSFGFTFFNDGGDKLILEPLEADHSFQDVPLAELQEKIDSKWQMVILKLVSGFYCVRHEGLNIPKMIVEPFYWYPLSTAE